MTLPDGTPCQSTHHGEPCVMVHVSTTVPYHKDAAGNGWWGTPGEFFEHLDMPLGSDHQHPRPRSINEGRRSRGMPEFPMTITGPALHPTQIRAYALIAASNMLGSSVGFHPHPGNVADWEGRVLKSAAHFVDFINKGTTEESEAAS